MYNIITATTDDIPNLLALYHSLHNTPGCTWPDDYPNEEFIKEDISLEQLFCIKDGEGKIIAAISMEKDPEVANLPNWNLPSDQSLELSRIAVSLDYQNQGIARLLIGHCIKVAKERDLLGIYLLVSQRNFKALASYHKLGFTCCGHAHLFEQDWYCYEKPFV